MGDVIRIWTVILMALLSLALMVLAEGRVIRYLDTRYIRWRARRGATPPPAASSTAEPAEPPQT